MSGMTFCGNLSGKEKLGYKENPFCPSLSLSIYKKRVLDDGGTFESEQCVLDYLTDKKIEL